MIGRAILRAFAACLATLASLPVQAQVADTPQLLEADRIAATASFENAVFYRTFRHAKVQIDGVPVHYVVGGSGPVVLLLHGWPASWSYWRRIMPALAAGHTVISVDMPGFGTSGTAPSADKLAVSALLHKLMLQLGHKRVSLVSHDMGGPVAYAYAAQFPDEVDKVVFTETAIPGFGFADGGDHDLLKITAQSASSIWHFAAFMKPGMAEMLIRGHERQFIDAMVTESYTNPAAFSEDEAEELTRWISNPTGLSGGIAYYRALFRDADDNRKLAVNKLAMPVLVLNGADGFLQYPGPGSVRAVASNVRDAVVPASGHFIAMERPGYLAKALIAFLDVKP